MKQLSEAPTVHPGATATETVTYCVLGCWTGSEEERRARDSPITEHLSAALGVPVDVKVTAGVAGVVEALLSGQIGMFYFGASGYATAHEETEGNLSPMVSLLVLYREVWKFALGCGAEPLLGRAPAGAAHSGIPWSC